MTSGGKLFFFIATFPFLLAKAVPLEFSLVPIINCYDLNGNGSSDFIAIPKSDLPRTLYHIELSSTNTEILWEFTMPIDKKGYFVDVILGDFNKEGTKELFAVANQEGGNDIFYIFSSNAAGEYSVSPIITGLENLSTSINNPIKLYLLEENVNQQPMFLLSNGSPNRKVIMCEFLNNQIIVRGTVGEKFLKNTIAPIDIALGDFNGDREEDIFILDNGITPAGYFIYSDGNEEEANISNFPRFQLLNEKGVDINFDGTDDLLIINKNGELMSNIWDGKAISLAEKGIKNIIINPDNGFLYLTTISQMGKIGSYSIDPLTHSVLSSKFELPAFINTDYNQVFSLATSHELIISHDGDQPEIFSIPLAMELITDTPPPIQLQRIYYQEPDYVINVGEDFSHHIGGSPSASFRNFTEENIPIGMKFNLEEIKLVWTPEKNQLGYHKLSYTLESMERDSLKITINEGKKIVTQNEYVVEKKYSYLIYVNDLVTFKNDHHHTTIVNGELFKWIIPIDDNNGDTQLSVEILSGDNNAVLHLLPSEIISDSVYAISEFEDTISVDTVVNESVYLDTVQIEVEKSKTKEKLLKEEEIQNVEDVGAAIDSLGIQPSNLLKITEEIIDTLIKREEVLVDSNYMEISYMELVSHQAQFSWEPHVELGDYNFMAIVTDGFTIDTMTLTLTVHPGIDLSMNTTQFTTTVGEFFNTDLIHKQIPSAPNYEYKLNNAPENMLIDTTGSINWVPLPTQVDNYNFEIEMTDGIASSQLEYDIYVNAPPVISSRPPTIFILPQGRKLNFALKSFDLNSVTKLEWELLSGPTEMTLNQQGVLQWNGNELGHHPYEIQLSDGIDSVQWEASIYVNTPPVITSLPIKTVSQGGQYSYPLNAYDENETSPFDSLASNEIIFSLVQGPEGMNIDENNILSWKTGDNPPGEYMVAFTASDRAEDAIQVFPVFINSFPVITSPDSVTVLVGDTLKFQIRAHDPNPMDTLTFHLDTLNEDLVMELYGGLLTWEPKESNIGLHTFNLKVKDGHHNTGTTMQLQIYVYRQPKLITELPVEAFSDIEYTTFLAAEDMYGNKLIDPESIIIDSATFDYYNFSENTHLFQWTPREENKGDHKIIIKLTDDAGFTTYHAHKLSVFANPCIHCDKEHKFAPSDTTGN